MDVIQRPIDLDGQELVLLAHVGVCIARPDYDADVLLRNAEVALHEAHQLASRMAFFSESLSISAVDRMDLRRDLEQALAREEMIVHYQPCVDLVNVRVAGFEALLRWNHSKRGLVSPVTFIPLAEDSGLIVPMGEWVLEQACAQTQQWNLTNSLDLTVTVNVSPRQLKAAGFANTVDRILARTNTLPSALTLELTETNDLNHPEVKKTLAELREIGVGLAADDFGGGVSASAVSRDLPFTVAKLDKSFVAALDSSYDKATRRLGSVIRMAHEAGMKVSSEGIESREQYELLRSMRCDFGQGYFFGRPTDAHGAMEYIATHCQPTVSPRA